MSGGANPGMALLGYIHGANMNSTADQAISMPNAASGYWGIAVIVCNASTTNTVAQNAQIWTGTSHSGTNFMSAQISTSSLVPGTTDVYETTADLYQTKYTASTLYFSWGTAQGSASTCDVYIYGFPTLAASKAWDFGNFCPINTTIFLPTDAQVIGVIKSVDFTVTTDQAITLFTRPFTNWTPVAFLYYNSSGTFTSAAGSVYTAASKGGTALYSTATTYTSLNSGPSKIQGTASNSLTTKRTEQTLYFNLTTAGTAGAATADLIVLGRCSY